MGETGEVASKFECCLVAWYCLSELKMPSFFIEMDAIISFGVAFLLV